MQAPAMIYEADEWRAWLGEWLDPDRVAHVDQVWQRGQQLSLWVPDIPANMFSLACLLHDVGRAVDPDEAAPHALAGARLLDGVGMPRALVLLVAHHSGARFEAAMRGYSSEMARYRYPSSPAMVALTYLDATTGPHGERLSPEERYDDIAARYGDQSWQAQTFVHTLLEIRWGAELVERLAPRLL